MEKHNKFAEIQIKMPSLFSSLMRVKSRKSISLMPREILINMLSREGQM